MNRQPGLNLGALEMATLECVWSLGEADVKRVHAEIGGARRVTSNTIQSTLDRLHRKELLKRRKLSHAFIYSPAVDRAALLGRAIDAVIAQLNGLQSGAALNAFVDFAARGDRNALEELERLVAERIASSAGRDRPC